MFKFGWYPLLVEEKQPPPGCDQAVLSSDDTQRITSVLRDYSSRFRLTHKINDDLVESKMLTNALVGMFKDNELIDIFSIRASKGGEAVLSWMTCLKHDCRFMISQALGWAAKLKANKLLVPSLGEARGAISAPISFPGVETTRNDFYPFLREEELGPELSDVADLTIVNGSPPFIPDVVFWIL